MTTFRSRARWAPSNRAFRPTRAHRRISTTSEDANSRYRRVLLRNPIPLIVFRKSIARKDLGRGGSPRALLRYCRQCRGHCNTKTEEVVLFERQHGAASLPIPGRHSAHLRQEAGQDQNRVQGCYTTRHDARSDPRSLFISSVGWAETASAVADSRSHTGYAAPSTGYAAPSIAH